MCVHTYMYRAMVESTVGLHSTPADNIRVGRNKETLWIQKSRSHSPRDALPPRPYYRLNQNWEKVRWGPPFQQGNLFQLIKKTGFLPALLHDFLPHGWKLFCLDTSLSQLKRFQALKLINKGKTCKIPESVVQVTRWTEVKNKKFPCKLSPPGWSLYSAWFTMVKNIYMYFHRFHQLSPDFV